MLFRSMVWAVAGIAWHSFLPQNVSTFVLTRQALVVGAVGACRRCSRPNAVPGWLYQAIPATAQTIGKCSQLRTVFCYTKHLRQGIGGRSQRRGEERSSFTQKANSHAGGTVPVRPGKAGHGVTRIPVDREGREILLLTALIFFGSQTHIGICVFRKSRTFPRCVRLQESPLELSQILADRHAC